MPLTFLKNGEEARVLKVRGKGDVHHHLENLGFVSDAPLKVVTVHGGNIIVEIKGAQVALDKSAASRIITC
ncbi:MAG: ferrous iron transport protein A [Eggerthellaceae bacterium]|nr:ferrous iron transport protein A [Eggerthellaceae bacterium]